MRRRPLAVPAVGLWLIACLLGIIGGIAALLAQEAPAPDVTVTLDRTRVTVGDPVTLTVVIRHVPGVAIVTTSLDDQLGNLEPLSSDPPEERSSGGLLDLRLRYKVAAYHTGAIDVPAFVIDYRLPDGTQKQAVAKGGQQITVQSVLPPGSDPSDIRPLKPQASLPVPASTRLIWIGAGLGGAALLALVVLSVAFLVRMGRRPVPVAPLSQAAVARAELDRIMTLNLVVLGDLVEHYRLMAACIRRYMTEQFNFPALALTSNELPGRMEAQGIERWPARLISGLLSECDAVTYARFVPAAPRIEADNAMAYEIIDQTEGVDAPPAVRAV